jgi:hypothetical protein
MTKECEQAEPALKTVYYDKEESIITWIIGL